MTSDTQATSIKPNVIIIAVIVIVMLVVLFWQSADEPPVEPVQPTEPAPVAEPIAPVVEPEPEPEVFEATPEPEAVELPVDAPIDPIEPPPVTEPEPEPVDVSDIAIESALVAIANNDLITDFLVDEAILQRFVVTVTNLANDEMAPNHRLLTPPDKTFRVYQQADRNWIDPASYKRYTPYIEAMETLDNERLLTLFERYENDMVASYEEIALSRLSFNDTMIVAINTLLDTPEVPMPVEVYTDSVTYKYKDERLENLSAPQKQLLRTGPDNMRRIKAKLREIKSLLEDRES